MLARSQELLLMNHSLTFISADGARGVMASPSGDLDRGTPETEVLLDNGQTLRVPTNRLARNPDGSYSLEQVTLPVIAEVVEVNKRVVPTGAVRIQKTVSEREEVVDPPLYTETYEVRHILLNREIEGPIAIRQEGDTTIYPVVEEVLVVTKQLVLREEVHVTRRIAESHRPERILLRSEEIAVERIAFDVDATEAQRDPQTGEG